MSEHTDQPVFDSQPGDENGGCLFCQMPVDPATGKRTHEDGCPAKNIAEQRDRLREQFRHDQEQKLRDSAKRAGSVGKGDWPLTPAQQSQFREIQALSQGKAGPPLSEVERQLREAQAEAQYRAEHERQLDEQHAQQQRVADSVAKRLLGETPEEQAERHAAGVGPLPEWVQQMLRQQGVPDAVFQEWRGNSPLPRLDLKAERPSPELPTPHYTLPERTRKVREGLAAITEFFDDVDPQPAQLVEAIERSMRDGYLNAGAIYGPSDDGLWEWATEATEMQRCLNRMQQISQRQAARRQINLTFPKFWAGEWDVAPATSEAEVEVTFDPTQPRNPAFPDQGPAPAGSEERAHEAAEAASAPVPEMSEMAEQAEPPAPAQPPATDGGLPPVDTDWMD